MELTSAHRKLGAAVWRRGLGAATAAALAVVPMAGVAVAREGAGAQPQRATPIAAAPTAVGTWSVRATGDDGNVIDSVLTVAADGTLANNVGGTGTWTATGRTTFTFRMTERFHDADGNLVARIEIGQKAVLCHGGRTFTSSGTAVTYDGAGLLVATNQVSATGTRG
ncbi:hypothetical protein [Streptomyces sp. TRM49041]|uniref:hypothetical protein n=1 Tax=Streptomyces sp. TRM49041 TaxID=2603216 RepID=UPI0011ECF817|nr:hypothetical protein [Streptomyces sp. TRM49041]